MRPQVHVNVYCTTKIEKDSIPVKQCVATKSIYMHFRSYCVTNKNTANHGLDETRSA